MSEVFAGVSSHCKASFFINMNPMWKIYKSKVMKTLDPEYEEDTAEEVKDSHRRQMIKSMKI